MDKLTKEQRKRNMQANKSTGTKPEILLAKMLFARGYRYKKNDKDVFGHPDLTFKKIKLAIFVDGEFWHGKDWEKRKKDHKTNKDFWIKKIERNIERDKEVNEELTKQGWIILRFWSKEIEKSLLSCILKIENEIRVQTMNFNGKTNSEVVPTHYLHNTRNGVVDFYKDTSVNFTKEILEFESPKEEITIPVTEKKLQYYTFNTFQVPFPPVENPEFKFIDLFAGIGGFRLALQNLGGKCVFTSEWDREAQKTYKANFGEIPFGDITKETTKSYIPDNFDILCAGFPCQAFSIAGKRGGFEDTRGTLFFDVAEIIKRKQPKAVFLENVKGLRSHNKGKTLETILNVLRNDLGYFVPEPEIVNAKDFGLPQNRKGFILSLLILIQGLKTLNILNLQIKRQYLQMLRRKKFLRLNIIYQHNIYKLYTTIGPDTEVKVMVLVLK